MTRFALALVSLIALTTRAFAQSPSPIALEWSAPPECPDAAAVLDDVRALAPAASMERAIVRAEITPTTTGHWRVHLITVIDSAIGERTMDADTCAGAAHAAAIVLGLALTSGSVASPPPEAVRPADPSPAPPTTSSPRGPRVRAALFAGTRADVGTLPTTSLGIDVGAALRFRGGRVDLLGSVFPNQHASIGNGWGADVALFAATVRGCWIGAWRHVELGACGGIEVGAMEATGTGVRCLGVRCSPSSCAFEHGFAPARPPMSVPVSRIIPFRRGVAPASTDGGRFDEIYAQHAGYLWRVLIRLGVLESAVEDALQDVFVVVHRQLAGFEGRASVRTWLFAIAVHVARDHRRAARRRPTDGAVSDRIVDTAPGPSETAMRHEALRVLDGLLDRLEDDLREVFVMAELEELTMPEIAEVLATNINTLYARLRRARAEFERLIRGQMKRLR